MTPNDSHQPPSTHPRVKGTKVLLQMKNLSTKDSLSLALKMWFPFSYCYLFHPSVQLSEYYWTDWQGPTVYPSRIHREEAEQKILLWIYAGFTGVRVAQINGWGGGLCRGPIWSASGFVWFVSLNLLLDFPIDNGNQSGFNVAVVVLRVLMLMTIPFAVHLLTRIFCPLVDQWLGIISR